MDLTAASLLYRDPAAYDAVTQPDTKGVLRLIDSCAPRPATSLLDVGCGTGSLLAALPDTYTRRVGVDLLPGMVDHARRAQPGLDVRLGDMRTLRLGMTFDAITCVGLVLSYLESDGDLKATLAALADHAHEGTVLVAQTLTEPAAPGPAAERRTSLHGRPVTVRTSYEWDDPILTLLRRWEFDDGDVVEDVLPRRVWPAAKLESAMIDAGFVPSGVRNWLRAATVPARARAQR